MTGISDRSTVGIKVNYSIQHETETETESKDFGGCNVKEARMGLPVGTVPTKPKAGDYGYSSLHDGGELPPLREHSIRDGGELCRLVACVENAKEFNDSFLTNVINKAKGTGASNPSKRPKI